MFLSFCSNLGFLGDRELFNFSSDFILTGFSYFSTLFTFSFFKSWMYAGVPDVLSSIVFLEFLFDYLMPIYVFSLTQFNYFLNNFYLWNVFEYKLFDYGAVNYPSSPLFFFLLSQNDWLPTSEKWFPESWLSIEAPL